MGSFSSARRHIYWVENLTAHSSTAYDLHACYSSCDSYQEGSDLGEGTAEGAVLQVRRLSPLKLGELA